MPLAQTMNYADVNIHGLELSARAPFELRPGVVTVTAGAAFTRGDVETGAASPLVALHDGPADNITPAKVVAAVRFTEPGGRWWTEYGIRTQADVTRVSPALLESPFLIAQDLLSLDGFTVHRISAGVDIARVPHTIGVVFAVENLTDEFYREQFQFAPARGRSFTVGLRVGAF
jgi:outer membrane receptor protein involved in Fe transport